MRCILLCWGLHCKRDSMLQCRQARLEGVTTGLGTRGCRALLNDPCLLLLLPCATKHEITACHIAPSLV